MYKTRDGLELSSKPSQQSLIGIRIDEKLDIQKIAKVLFDKNENTFNDDYASWVNLLRFVEPTIRGIIVQRLMDRLALL